MTERGGEFGLAGGGGQRVVEGDGFCEAMDSGISAGRWRGVPQGDGIPLNDGSYSVGVLD